MKMTLKYWNFALLAGLFAMLAAACGTDSNAQNKQPELLEADLRTDRTLVNRIDEPGLPDYLVTAPISVWATVKVEPGVRIAFAPDASLWVGSATGQGSLNAVGTAALPIVFTAQDASAGASPSWKGLGFGSSSVLNRLEFVTVEHAGSAELAPGLKGAVIVLDGKLSLVDSRLQDNGGAGLAAAANPGASAQLGDLMRNVITRNDAAVTLPVNLFAAIDASNQLSGNTQDSVDIQGSDFGSIIQSDLAIPSLGVPYRISGRLSFAAKVSVAAGAHFLMRPDALLTVGDASGVGSLSLSGSSAAPIIIEGELASAGSWGGIMINSASALNQFSYLQIGHGGSVAPLAGQAANIVVGSGGGASKLSLSNSSLHDSAGFGVYVTASSQLTESSNSYSNNSAGDLGQG